MPAKKLSPARLTAANIIILRIAKYYKTTPLWIIPEKFRPNNPDELGPDFLRLLEKLLNIYGVHEHVTLLIGDACEKRLAAKAGRQGVRKHVTLMDLKTILTAYKEGQEKRKAREAADSDTESVAGDDEDEEDAQEQDASDVDDIEDGGVFLNKSKRVGGATLGAVSAYSFEHQETTLTDPGRLVEAQEAQRHDSRGQRDRTGYCARHRKHLHRASP